MRKHLLEKMLTRSHGVAPTARPIGTTERSNPDSRTIGSNFDNLDNVIQSDSATDEEELPADVVRAIQNAFA